MRDTRPRSLFRAVRGPITLITVGVLFALNNFTQYRVEQTWPVVLIVFGLLSLMRRSFEPSQPPPPPNPTPYGYPPPPTPQGTYSQGPYKGGSSTGGTQPK
jgi:hypothetical protein